MRNERMGKRRMKITNPSTKNKHWIIIRQRLQLEFASVPSDFPVLCLRMSTSCFSSAEIIRLIALGAE